MYSTGLYSNDLVFKLDTDKPPELGEYYFYLNKEANSFFKEGDSKTYQFLMDNKFLTDKNLSDYLYVRIIYLGPNTHLNIKLVEINYEPVKGNYYYQADFKMMNYSKMFYTSYDIDYKNFIIEITEPVVTDPVYSISFNTPLLQIRDIPTYKCNEDKYFGKED